MAITATAARKDLYRLLEEVNQDHDEIEITSKAESAFLVSAFEYNALKETAYLLRSPANAARLAESAREVAQGKSTRRDLVDVSKDEVMH